MTLEEENQELRRNLDKLQTRFTHLRRDFLIVGGLSGFFIIWGLIYIWLDKKVEQDTTTIQETILEQYREDYNTLLSQQRIQQQQDLDQQQQHYDAQLKHYEAQVNFYQSVILFLIPPPTRPIPPPDIPPLPTPPPDI